MKYHLKFENKKNIGSVDIEAIRIQTGFDGSDEELMKLVNNWFEGFIRTIKGNVTHRLEKKERRVS